MYLSVVDVGTKSINNERAKIVTYIFANFGRFWNQFFGYEWRIKTTQWFLIYGIGKKFLRKRLELDFYLEKL